MGSLSQPDLIDPSPRQSGCRWLVSVNNTKEFVLFIQLFSFFFKQQS